MTTLDDEIQIEVVRKEEITEVPVYFKVDNYTKASMTYLQYVRFFNWRDAKGGNCEELISFLTFAFGITFNQPQCYVYNYPSNPEVDSEVEIEDSEHLVRLSLQRDLERIILAIDDDPYRTLYTGKICGYEDLDVYAEMYEKSVTLPSEVVLLPNQRPKFKVYVDGTKAIEFELGVTKDRTVNCERVWGIKDWCTRTTAPRVNIEGNTVNISIDPIHITSDEVLTTLQERGKIDVEKLPPALLTGVSGWTWVGSDVAPLGSLSTDMKLRYHVPWSPYDYPFSPLYFMFTIDLTSGNPPTNTAAIDMSSACDGKLPCAPIIHASLEGLPIVEQLEPEVKFVVWYDSETGDKTVEVHPYIMVVPGEVSPVVNAIVNTGDESIAVDMWEVFGGIELLPHRTPVIPIGETIDFDYMTTRPDLPLGQYECTFYLGQHDKGIIYDEFTQPAIIIVDHCIIAESTELTIPTPVYPGQTYTGVLCVDVLSIRAAKSAFADLWVCKDGDKTWEKMKEVGMTIVDRRLWPLMEETRIGLTRTETLYPDNHYCLEFEFTVPSDWTPGTYELDLYFGEWDKYFTYWGSVTRFFTVEVVEKEEVNGTINIPASDIPSFLYQQTPSAFDMAVINTGTLPAEYQVAITFEGVDVANEEVFWSNWSGDVAPNESVMIPVPVELSEEAIPEGAETAEYNIDAKLVAR